VGRNPEAIRAGLSTWLRGRLPGAERIELAPLAKAAGGSSETYFVDAAISEGGAARREAWVLRVEPTEHQIYQDADVGRQFRVLREVAACTKAPVPQALWHEADAAAIGAPFFLMARVEGALPDPFHHGRGLLAEAAPAQREAMWASAIETLAEIHKAPVEPFGFLGRPELGASGLDQEIALWDAYVRWTGNPLHPVQERTRRWLDDHAPRERPTGLAWGDARPGNLVFRDARCVAVLDWETASLGGAETDLGWWLFYDWFVTDGCGFPRLEGLGGPAAFLAAWEGAAGRKARDVGWHEVFATWRFSLIRDRAMQLAAAAGVTIEGAPPDDPIVDRLARLIAG
jgi:aminoglycoside phosphotransferase (APT) family kinase protein